MGTDCAKNLTAQPVAMCPVGRSQRSQRQQLAGNQQLCVRGLVTLATAITPCTSLAAAAAAAVVVVAAAFAGRLRLSLSARCSLLETNCMLL